jgi:phage gp36-like protein
MISQEDLLKEISLEELTQLTDLNATGKLDETVLQDAIDDALAFIGSFIEIPEDPSPLLREIAVELTVDYLRRRNRLGDDDERLGRRAQLERYLLKMAAKQIPATPAQTPNPSGASFRHRGRKLDLKGWR